MDTVTHYQRSIYYWLLTGVFLISMMVIIGGITRLTDSGLSMSDWNLIMGTIPPMNEVEWDRAFERYQEFPQFQQLNSSMTKEEFKGIFFWEYLHRLLGRLTGLIFIFPFLYFIAKKYLDPTLLKRLILLLLLGASQGAMGWIMVKSGLNDVPYVSHYRLAAHFSLAFILVGYCYWIALDVKYGQAGRQMFNFPGTHKRWLQLIGVLFWIQLIYGAFVAGLDAGYMYNTFPLMEGQWLPPTFTMMEPFWINLFENPGTVQWIHRLNGTFLLIASAVFFWKSFRMPSQPAIIRLSLALLIIIIAQYLLGIFTLIFHVPISLGVLHQAVAILFWLVYLQIWHQGKIHSTPVQPL